MPLLNINITCWRSEDKQPEKKQSRDTGGQSLFTKKLIKYMPQKMFPRPHNLTNLSGLKDSV